MSERCVFVANGRAQAHQVKAFLEASGVSSALRGESLSSTHGLTLDGLGRVEIVVAPADEAEARSLLAAAAAGEFELEEGAEIPALEPSQREGGRGGDDQ